jgi:pyruvate ferredoxin oxidoreductase beta subunit
MELQTVKFYQTGTFTVGNRLLAEDERSVQANMDRTNSLNSGHRACQGCGEALGARYAIDAAMRATDGELIAVNRMPRGVSTYPETSILDPLAVRQRSSSRLGVAAAMRVKAGPASVSLPRVATAARPISDSAACRECSSAMTTFSTSATTTKPI